MAITVQSDMISIRWNLDLNSPEGHYPGFHEAFVPAHEFLTSSIDSLLEPGFFAPTAFTLAYSNFVICPGLVTWGDVAKYLKLEVPPLAIESRRLRGYEFSFQRLDGFDYGISLRASESADTPQKSGFLLTNAAGAQVEHPLDFNSRLQDVHGALVNVFSELISDYAATEWGRV